MKQRTPTRLPSSQELEAIRQMPLAELMNAYPDVWKRVATSTIFGWYRSIEMAEVSMHKANGIAANTDQADTLPKEFFGELADAFTVQCSVKVSMEGSIREACEQDWWERRDNVVGKRKLRRKLLVVGIVVAIITLLAIFMPPIWWLWVGGTIAALWCLVGLVGLIAEIVLTLRA